MDNPLTLTPADARLIYLALAHLPTHIPGLNLEDTSYLREMGASYTTILGPAPVVTRSNKSAYARPMGVPIDNLADQRSGPVFAYPTGNEGFDSPEPDPEAY